MDLAKFVIFDGSLAVCQKDKSLTNNVTEVCVRNTLFVQLCTSTKPTKSKAKILDSKFESRTTQS